MPLLSQLTGYSFEVGRLDLELAVALSLDHNGNVLAGPGRNRAHVRSSLGPRSRDGGRVS